MTINDSELQRLSQENAHLRQRLEDAEETLNAIRRGDVDALVVGEDIYTLESASAEYNRLRNDVLAQMEDAVLAFDAEDHVIFMNPAAERQYLSSASEILGRLGSEVYRQTWQEPGAEVLARKALDEEGTYRAHTLHTRNDGRSLHVESTVSKLRDAHGQVVGYLAVIRDITDRVRAEETLKLATMALAQRERQFSTLVENSPDIIARMDEGFRYMYVSPAIEYYTGLKPADCIGRTSSELNMPEAYCTTWRQVLMGVFSGGEARRIKFEFPDVNNQLCVFDARVVPELSEDGTIESVLCISSDITEQERSVAALQESQARLQFTLDSAQIGDWDIDLKTGIANHSLRHDRCFGYTQHEDEWDFEKFLRHVYPDDRAYVQRRFDDSLKSHDSLDFECRVIWPDNSLHWIEVHGSILYAADKPQRMLGIVQDVTARKLAEQALHEADRRKDEFLATLAHELRNPLAPIRNALQIMRLSREAEVQENARTIIERQLLQMVHLVDDLMDVSRISQGKVALRLERVDVVSIAHTAIETSRPLIDSGRHEVNLTLPEPGELIVNADVTRLTQIIANLLNNAAKYTSDGGSIALTVAADGDEAVITVQDTGVGIPPKLLPRVFDMFAQVDRTLERSQGGLGIGLALVKRLVEMHDGSVQAHSEGQGKGCRFTVRLPRLGQAPPAPAEEPPAEAAEADSGSALRVLVVDDNLDSAESLAEVLGLLGYETRTAADGFEAVHLTEQWQPRVVVLDIGLPGMSGHEAAERIRQLPAGKEMLLIALSGWGQSEDLRKSEQAGFDEHFVKPLDIKLLLDRLAAVR